MESKKLKKILAGVGMAALVSTVGVATPGAVQGGSGWTSKDDSTVGAEKDQRPGTSGWSGQDDGAVSTDEVEKPAGTSGWSGQDDGAVSTEDDDKKATGDSGWSGSK